MNKKECKVCIHNETCTLDNPKTCEFEPIESAEKFFAWGEFHPKSEDCVPTLSVLLNDNTGRRPRKRICPYCGDEMFKFEQYDMYDSIAYYRCICDGALAEREYEDKANKLKYKYYTQKKDLESQYEQRLKFNGMEKIIDLKLEIEKDELLSSHRYDDSGVFEKLDNQHFENRTIEI